MSDTDLSSYDRTPYTVKAIYCVRSFMSCRLVFRIVSDIKCELN